MFKTPREQEFFKKILNVESHNELAAIFTEFEIIIDGLFNIDDAQKWYKVKYNVIPFKKRYKWVAVVKFEGDEKLYNNDKYSLINDKKELVNIYKCFEEYIKNIFDDDVFKYINKKYIKKVSSFNYDDFKYWFICLFIYYIEYLNKNTVQYKINIKHLNQWLEVYNKEYLTNVDKFKKLLKSLNKLKQIEDDINIKIFFDLIINNFNCDIKIILK